MYITGVKTLGQMPAIEYELRTYVWWFIRCFMYD